MRGAFSERYSHRQEILIPEETHAVNDTLAGLLGVALIAGLFAAHSIQRRRRNAPAPPPETAERPSVSVSAKELQATSSSPNWGMPIVYCLLLAAADSHRGNFWGYLWQWIFFAFLAVAAYSTFSPKELAMEQTRRPGTTRQHQYLTLGVPYLLFPAIGWALVELAGWPGGVFVPAIPWLLLLIAGGAAAVWQKWRGRKQQV